MSSNIWIINQPYHLSNISLYNTQFPGKNKFIVIKHREIYFKNDEEYISLTRYINVLHFIVSFKKIKEELKKVSIKKTDRIFVFNGQELVNNFVLSHIAKRFSKNIYIVDDGSSVYKFYLTKLDSSKRIIDFIKMKFLNLFFKVDLVLACNLRYYNLHSNFVKNIIFPYRVNYSGSLNVKSVICNDKIITNLDENSIVFLSQPFYLPDPGYLTEDDYAKLLNIILQGLTNNFKTVYFKLHPNDSTTLIEKLNCEGVELLDQIFDFESYLLNNNSKFIISFNSNSLLECFQTNKTTVWLFELLSDQCRYDFQYLENIIKPNGGINIENWMQFHRFLINKTNI
jgi:hypothetical protein